MLVGFVIAAVPGVIIGLAMGLYWPLRVFLMPVATAIYAIPKLAVLPLMLIVFGIGEGSKVAIIVVSIFFLIVLNTMSGVLAIDPIYRDVAQNLGASRWQMFTTVAWPGALPAIFTGFRLAIGFALLVIVGTEFLDGNKREPNGLGWYIIRSWNLLKIDDLFVGSAGDRAAGLDPERADRGCRAARSAMAAGTRHEREPQCPSRLALRRFRVWLRAVRIFSFTASITPV